MERADAQPAPRPPLKVALLTDQAMDAPALQRVAQALAGAVPAGPAVAPAAQAHELSAANTRLVVLLCQQPRVTLHHVRTLRAHWSASHPIIAITTRPLRRAAPAGVFTLPASEAGLVQLPALVNALLDAGAARQLQEQLTHLERSIELTHALTSEAFWEIDRSSLSFKRYHALLPTILGVGAEALAADPWCWLPQARWNGEPLSRPVLAQWLASERFDVTLEMDAEPGPCRHVQWMGQRVPAQPGLPATVVGVARDITQAVEREAAATERATRDPLTKLPNRALLRDRVDIAIHAARRAGAQLAVLYLDLDYFKAVNDRFGHAAGDHVLQVAAQRMLNALRVSDTVARMGGDEFVVILHPLNQEIGPSQVAQKLISALMEPIPFEGHHLKIGASIGIAIFPHDGSHFDELMNRADTALYRAKAGGRCTFALYRRDLDLRFHQDLKHRSALVQAIREGQLAVHYQPVVNLRTGQSDSVEALIRSGTSELDAIAPAQLIAMAEEMGLMDELGEWVAREVFQQVCEWNYNGLIGVHVAINLSPLQLKSRRFTDLVKQLIKTHRLDANLFSVELSEAALMDATGKLAEGLQSLTQLGLRIAVDDFGTSFSNLSRLRQMPISHLKFDRSLVQQVHLAGPQSLIGGLIELAHRIDLTVVAEGVESRQQLERLAQLHCDFAQGFDICRPVSGAELQDVLLNWRPPIQAKRLSPPLPSTHAPAGGR